jgi:hypothetical protein
MARAARCGPWIHRTGALSAGQSVCPVRRASLRFTESLPDGVAPSPRAWAGSCTEVLIGALTAFLRRIDLGSRAGVSFQVLNSQRDCRAGGTIAVLLLDAVRNPAAVES